MRRVCWSKAQKDLQVQRGEHLNEHANFETFPSAVLLLFRIATADEWTGIMSDASVAPPHCDPDAGNCGTRAAPVYIMSFALLIGQIMLNLFTTIVIETFEEMDEVRSSQLSVYQHVSYFVLAGRPCHAVTAPSPLILRHLFVAEHPSTTCVSVNTGFLSSWPRARTPGLGSRRMMRRYTNKLR